MVRQQVASHFYYIKNSTRASAHKPYARRRIFLSSRMQGGFISLLNGIL